VGESPYRSAYAVEDHVRAPSHEELALIDQRRERDLAIRRKSALAGPKSALNMAAVALVVLAVGAILRRPAVVFGAGLVAILCAAIGWLGFTRAREALRARRGRWDVPDAQWRTHETRIRARSVVYAASEDEDYITWIVFEIPGGQWAAIDDLWVPPERRTELANEDLVLTWLEPANECIGVALHGGPLPRHGALRLGEPEYEGDDFAQAIADGFGWSDEEAYEEGIDPGEGPIRMVPEAELPQWMRDAVGRD